MWCRRIPLPRDRLSSDMIVEVVLQIGWIGIAHPIRLGQTWQEATTDNLMVLCLTDKRWVSLLVNTIACLITVQCRLHGLVLVAAHDVTGATGHGNVAFGRLWYIARRLPVVLLVQD